MTEKRCCTCLDTKPIDAFYKNRSMPDGHGKRCKACVRSLETEGNRLATERYLKSERGVQKRREYLRAGGNDIATLRYRQTNQTKRIANNAVNNALARGKIKRPDACSQCASQSKLEAHHDDYAQKLSVRWLCVPCHNAWHRANGEGANSGHEARV